MLLSASSLQNDVKRMNMDAEGKRKLAEISLQKAQSYEQQGNEAHAETERKMAEKFLAEAERLEQQGNIYHAQMLARQREAEAIDGQISALKADYDQKMKQLEKEKQDILG